MLLRRIVLLYIVLLLCRIVFYCYNYALIGPLGWQEVLTLAGGGLKFDTVSVLYANLLFIVLSLLPFHFRERSWYRRILFWYYAVINSLLIVAVNLADCVYFRYTQKRFTADEIFFADNSNSVQLVLKFAAENWYLLLVGAVLIWLLRLGLRTQDHTPIAPARGLGLSLGQYRTAGDRHSARHRRHAGRRNAHDPPDHPLERHALRLDQRKGQPDPEQPLLHSADHRQRRIGQIHPLLFARKTGRIFHARPTAPTLRP